MLAMVGAVLTASLLGSGHCAGMCGPLLMLTTGTTVGGERPFGLQVAYHGGRLGAYVLMGAVAGGVAHILNLAGGAAGFTDTAAMIAAGIMIVWGGATLLHAAGLGTWRRAAWPGATRALGKIARYCATFDPRWRALTMGAMTPLLPCGWLYLFAVSAASTGAWWRGALTMAVFWLGTLPVLVALGAGLQRLAGKAQRHMPVVGALVIITIGLVGVWRRLPDHTAAQVCHHHASMEMQP